MVLLYSSPRKLLDLGKGEGWAVDTHRSSACPIPIQRVQICTEKGKPLANIGTSVPLGHTSPIIPLTAVGRAVGDRDHGRIESEGERDGAEFGVHHSDVDTEDGLRERKTGKREP